VTQNPVIVLLVGGVSGVHWAEAWACCWRPVGLGFGSGLHWMLLVIWASLKADFLNLLTNIPTFSNIFTWHHLEVLEEPKWQSLTNRVPALTRQPLEEIHVEIGGKRSHRYSWRADYESLRYCRGSYENCNSNIKGLIVKIFIKQTNIRR